MRDIQWIYTIYITKSDNVSFYRALARIKPLEWGFIFLWCVGEIAPPQPALGLDQIAINTALKNDVK